LPVQRAPSWAWTQEETGVSEPVALRIIGEEHAALAQLLRAMATLLRDARRSGRAPDFKALRAMLFYIDEFPERQHHVKESAMLFPRLRERTHDVDKLLDRLDRDHVQGEGRIRVLWHQLAAWELLGESRREPFERALADYTAFYLQHMRLEEEHVLPLARRSFGDDDWRILDRAFLLHRDPLTGNRPDAEYAELFRVIESVLQSPPASGPVPAA
jgi:hemerythrin-like domain-containing protein